MNGNVAESQVHNDKLGKKGGKNCDKKRWIYETKNKKKNPVQ